MMFENVEVKLVGQCRPVCSVKVPRKGIKEGKHKYSMDIPR